MWAGRLLSTCQVTLIYYVSLEEKKAKPMAKPSRLKIYILVVPYHRFPVLSVEARDPPHVAAYLPAYRHAETATMIAVREKLAESRLWKPHRQRTGLEKTSPR